MRLGLQAPLSGYWGMDAMTFQSFQLWVTGSPSEYLLIMVPTGVGSGN